ncbi:MAG: ATP-binding cassette domain-containing protein, partial [Pseudomonadota bacterium]|nr:ATP-binding cassette domain-containing protein [Pseudomonadota bacterium]
MNPDSLIEAHGLTKSFGRDAVITNVSVNVAPRNIVTVIGPNGSGKTTLLKLLLGLETPDAGTVRRKPGLTIGYVPQRLAIDPILPLTVEWFLRLSARGRDIRPLAEEVRITALLPQRLQSVSGGEMQRILLARALLAEPELLVLDEPAQGVDVNGQAFLYDLISRVSKEHHCAVLMVSHDLHLVMSSTD